MIDKPMRGRRAAQEDEPPVLPQSKVQKEESRAAKAAVEAENAKEEATKIEREAIQKAATVNDRLARDGDPRRLSGGVRNGEPKYFWSISIPVKEVTPEELEAISNL